MKLSTASSVFVRHPLERVIPLVAGLGFDGIDIWGGRPHAYRRDFSSESLKALARQARDNGLEMSSFMPAFSGYPHSLTSPNQRVRQDSINYMCESIDNAALLEAGIVLVVPDLTLHGDSKENATKRMIESIDVLSLYAFQYDIQLGLEILFKDETDLINTVDDALRIIEQLDRSNVGVVIDTGTMNLTKEQADQTVDKLRNLLLQVHVNDNYGADRQENLIPGEGTYDFTELIRALRKTAYAGFITAELSKDYATDPVPALHTTIERLKFWLAES